MFLYLAWGRMHSAGQNRVPGEKEREVIPGDIMQISPG